MEVARPLARRLGLTGALGTVAAERDGIYTGELVGDILLGPAKAEAVRGVGNPCAINPDSRLHRHAEVGGSSRLAYS
ncbi:MAG TPA: hypothetical protein VGD15_26220 [Kribbella sp.]